METRTVKPCGMLYSQGREYFLLKPYPIVGDSWERDNAYRWLVIPRKIIEMGGLSYQRVNDSETGFEEVFTNDIYPHARHIVSTAFVVDYTELPEIEIKVLEDLDVSELPEPNGQASFFDEFEDLINSKLEEFENV